MFALFNPNHEQARAEGRGSLAQQKLIAFYLLSFVAILLSLKNCIETSYSAVDVLIRLTKGVHMIVWSNFLLLNLGFVLKYFVRLLFGELRLIEYEHILERVSYSVVQLLIVFANTETFFLNVLHFGMLTYIKVLHWVLKDRMDFTFQGENSSRNLSDVLRSRYMLSLCMILIIDVLCLRNYALAVTNSPSFRYRNLFLLFEHLIVFVDYSRTFLLTALNIFEIILIKKRSRGRTVVADTNRDDYNSVTGNHTPAAQANFAPRDPEDEDEDEDEEMLGLEGKFIYEKFIETTTVLIGVIIKSVASWKLGNVLSVVGIVLDAINTFQSIKSMWKSWRSRNNLDSCLPDATDSQIESGEFDVCIVCMEDFVPSYQRKSEGKKVKILPCGHAFHLSCLKNWVTRSPTCPICRLPIFDDNGNVITSHNRASNADSSTDLSANTNVAESDHVSRGINIGESEHTQDSISGLLGSHTTASRNTPNLSLGNPSLILPITKSESRRHSFKLVTESGNEIEGTISLRSNVNKQNGTIILPSEMLMKCEVSDLKRKNTDMEGHLEDLNKKVKR